MATLADIAAHAGVGIGTVSRVLTDSPNVSDAMRARVMASVAAVGYDVAAKKRAQPASSGGLVGVLVTFFDEPSALQRFSGVVPRLQSNDLHVVLYNIESPSQARSALMELPRNPMLQGLIVVSLPLADAEALYKASGSPDKVLRVFTPQEGGAQHCMRDYAVLGVAEMWNWFEDKLVRS